MGFFGVLLAVPMAVIVSLAFHVPQLEEVEHLNIKEEKKTKLNFKKRKVLTKDK